VTEVTYICRSPQPQAPKQKQSLTCFPPPLDFFIAFLGVSKQGEFKSTDPKNHLGSSQNRTAFFPSGFFSPPSRLFCSVLDFFYRISGRFVTRGAQKRDKTKSQNVFRSRQNTYLLTSLLFF
jgi:hypothetical protein